MRLIETNDQNQTQSILSELLFKPDPEWVSLSSPYRPAQEQITLQEIHLSTWFAKNL